MGAIQSSINSMLGTAAAGTAGVKQLGQVAKLNENVAGVKSALDEQSKALSQPDYGKTMTNAIAEATALAKLQDARYAASKKILKAMTPMERESLNKAVDTAGERLNKAIGDYTQPAGKPFVRTLTEEDK